MNFAKFLGTPFFIKPPGDCFCTCNDAIKIVDHLNYTTPCLRIYKDWQDKLLRSGSKGIKKFILVWLVYWWVCSLKFNSFMKEAFIKSIDLPSKSMDLFLYDKGLRHERVKLIVTPFDSKSKFRKIIGFILT